MVVGDLDQVIPIELACFHGYWSRSVFEAELNQPVQRLWTLKQEQTLVAYYGVWRVLDEAHLTTLAVDPGWRGQQLGELALWLACDQCLQAQAQWLTLEVRASNTIALNLYYKYGFVEIGRRRRYYPDQEDALVLWRPGLQSLEFKKVLTVRQAALWELLQPRGWGTR